MYVNVVYMTTAAQREEGIKIHSVIYLRFVHFTVYKLYLKENH